MSYILDALRRADAERERGEVPGLQSQQHALMADEDAPPRSRLLLGAVAALSVALAAALGWNWFGAASAPSRQVAEAPPAPAVAMTPAAPVAPAPTVLPSTLPATGTLPAMTTAAAGTAATTAAAPATPAVQRPPTDRPTATATAEGRRAQRRPPAASAAASTTPALPALRAAADNRVYALAELPEEVRRDVPKLTVGGASYSGDPASRMVIINGQVFHEGDKLGNGLVLEKIKLKSAVLAFKGWRYEILF